ncbi:hypothetical protein MU582_15695 [Nocardioidaceae bacterium SCSIO 66511]|nr:hypothetical protein MU582_15695 [Nocardioidaceae bacterium SCSIO 66511]
MKAAYRLHLLLRQRTVGAADPQRTTSRLAIIAFATTTALLLIVIGGVGAFRDRADGLSSDDVDSQYPALAITAAVLLVIPLVALGGSAARLAVSRRDARLAALRLAGATTPQVTLIALLEAVTQGVIGAVVGAVGYLGLIPVFALVHFQGRSFGLGELWVGPLTLAATLLGVIALAALSSLSSLARVAITPLGVVNRHTPLGPTWIRLAVLGAALLAWIAVSRSRNAEAMTLIVVLALVFGAVSVAGPFVMWCAGRWTVRRAKDVPTLLAGRRIVDDPKSAWRTVGGVCLTTFIAVLACTMQTFGADQAASAEDAQLFSDMATGAYLTLAIAGVLAAVSTGVIQSARVIDQRSAYRMLALSGTETATLDKARAAEVRIPLRTGLIVSLLSATIFLIPLSIGFFSNPIPTVQLAGSLAAAVVLVELGAATARPVLRNVLARED